MPAFGLEELMTNIDLFINLLKTKFRLLNAGTIMIDTSFWLWLLFTQSRKWITQKFAPQY